MYREYYKIIIIVLLVGQGFGMAPLVLVLVKGMVNTCAPLYYVNKVKTH